PQNPVPSPNPNTLIITWGPNGPQDPFNWPLHKKWWTTGLGLTASFICSMNGTILTVAHKAISDEFHIPDTTFPNTYWLITSWGVGAALCPLFLFPIMEDFGIRPVLLSTYFLFTCLLIPIGLAQNFTTLLIVRFFSGGCVPLISDAVASIISNVFHGDRARSTPISLYVTIYLASTSIGPVIGSSILQFLSWRWIAYLELIWTAALFPILLIALPETRGSAILLAKAKQLRREGKNAYTIAELNHPPTQSFPQTITQSIQRPLYMLFTEPVVFIATLWAAFSLGTIYLFTQSVEQVYSTLYNWSIIQTGYIQIAIVIGELLGCALSIVITSHFSTSTSSSTPQPTPETALYPSLIGSLFTTTGMFLYGLTSSPSIHFLAPTIGLCMVGLGTTGVIIGNAKYLIDAYSNYAASALGAVGLVENISIAFLPLAEKAMYDGLGFRWASLVLGFVALGLVGTPVVVWRWGGRIRERSPFMKVAGVERGVVV
ncbi:putative MFS multidrug transporter, partial [Aspergillus sclerotiicarbonarius CBS 121057]